MIKILPNGFQVCACCGHFFAHHMVREDSRHELRCTSYECDCVRSLASMALEAQAAQIVEMDKGMKITDEEIKANKFYVGATQSVSKKWGHRTLTDAVEHGKRIVTENGGDDVIVVQVVRVLRRQQPPVDVKVVR